MPLKTEEPAAGGGSRAPEDEGCRAARRDALSNTLPLIIAQWPRNIRESLRVTLDEFRGRPIIDIRCWYWNEAGELKPGRSGITVSTRHLEQLAAAIVEAAKQAKERGLIDPRTER